MAKDYYKILGVERKADEKEIKKAYRKMARQHHPDINPNDKSAEARFKEINEAYQVLSDKDKRPLYDKYGADWEKIPAGYNGPPPGQYRPGAGVGSVGGVPGGVDFSEIFNQARRGGAQPTAGAQDADVGDLFETLFKQKGGRGGFNFGGKSRGRGPVRGDDIDQSLTISLPESIKGTQRALTLTIRDEDGREEIRNVTVKIPAGVRESARVRVANQGASGANGGPNGDLFLKINLAPHPFWKREGDDLHCEVPVSFGEAALGATIDVPTINGPVQMKIPAGTQSGQTFRLSGRGLKRKDGTSSDQFVRVKVTVPKNLSDKERDLIQELAQARQENPRAGLPSAI